MDYATLLVIHKITIGISLALFLLRGIWRMIDSPLMDRKWVKIVPHINDALLLAAAIGMLVVAGLNPLQHNWLLAQIIALLVYIGLGTVAIKRGETRQQRTLAFIGALLTFGYIAAVAVTKQVVPF